jgi:hypothetical protein
MYTRESVCAVLAAKSGLFAGGDGFADIIHVYFVYFIYIHSRVPQWEERARQLLPSVRVERIRQDIIDVAGKDIVHSAPERCRCRAASDGPASVTLNSF